MGNSKQYDVNAEVLQVHEDLAEALDKAFEDVDGAVPPSVKTILDKGTRLLESRNKDLLRADDAGWGAVEAFHRDPLCATESEEKRWKRAKEEVKEKEKDKSKKGGKAGYGVGGPRGGRGRGSFGFGRGYPGYQGYSPMLAPQFFGGGRGFMPRGRVPWEDSWRRYGLDKFGIPVDRVSSEPSSTAPGVAAAANSLATAEGVASGDTRPTPATSAWTSPSPRPSAQNVCAGVADVKNMSVMHAKDGIKQSDMKVFESDEQKLDRLEKVTLTLAEDDLIVMFDEEKGIEDKVVDTLRTHLGYWVETGASAFAQSIIRQGYIPSFESIPSKYEEPNNGSYKKHRLWANEAVDKLAQARLVKRVSAKELDCCNPLTVASNAVDKLRLCIDMSRQVNKVVKAPKFRIESTVEALQVAKQGDWGFAFDLKSAYHQVPLHPDFYKYFGFKIEKEEGKVEYYCYVVMPFGLNDASRVLTKLLKSPLERWRSMGIRIFLHIDDGLGLCSTREESLRASEQVRGDLIKYGLLISEKKCSWGASQTVEWTGFIWDFRSFKLWVPEKKLSRAEEAVKQLLAMANQEVSVKQVAKVVGLLGSFVLAMGAIVRFRTRALLINIAKETEVRGWKVNTVLGAREKEELEFWTQRLRDLNGYCMRKRDRVVEVATREMFSDASDFMLAGAEFVNVTRKRETDYQACLGAEELGTSSTYRELRAIEEGLKVRGRELQGSFVRWGCDNWAAGVIVRVGSMKFECHEVALRIAELARQWEIELETFWLSRNEPQIQEVDGLSKDFDAGDYKLGQADFRLLEQDFGPFSVDMFASSFSYQFQPFVSRVACSQAAAVDAFTLDWGKAGFMFLHPPVRLVVRVLRYAEACAASGVLIVPVWPGAIFMTELRAAQRVGKVQVLRTFRPNLVSPVWIKSKTFHGPARFDFLVCALNFS